MDQKCALDDCDKPARFGRMCCCPAHSRKLGGLRGAAVANSKPKSPYKKITKTEYKKPKVYKDYTPEQKARHLARIKSRTKRLKYATPIWANRLAIEEIYVKARMLTLSTGIKHEVDHIIPIKGVNVSGLHVENNLQILTKKENRSKWNYSV
jgi:5-methylcytosine-specific restriction endonuclease McrA